MDGATEGGREGGEGRDGGRVELKQEKEGGWENRWAGEEREGCSLREEEEEVGKLFFSPFFLRQ